MTIETEYPIGETIRMRLDMPRGAEFPLRFRVPGWSKNVAVRVNGVAANVAAAPGTWATIQRTWSPGDRVEVQIPLRFRWQAVDKEHPGRVAIVRGPVVMPLEFRYLEPLFHPPATDDELNSMLTPDTGTEVIHTLPSGAGAYKVRGTDGRPLMAMVRPFYQYTEDYPYLMYMDIKNWPAKLW